MKKKYDVITVGSALVDAFVPTHFKEKNKKISLPAGAKIPIDDIILTSGGGGTNSATVLSKLGLKVGYLGKIGKGINSNVILEDLKKFKIDFLGVRSDEKTGYSTIIESNEKNRTILTYKGSSNHLKINEIKLKNINTSWFHFTSMTGESFKTQKKLADFAIKNNIKISFNPGAYHMKKGLSYFKKILKGTVLLNMNRDESIMLFGKKASTKEIFKKLRKEGAEIICITNGKSKGILCDSKFIYSFMPNKVKVEECTGAGDTFACSLLCGLIKFNDIEKAICLALINSESVIQKIGAKNGLLSFSKAQKLLKNRKFKLIREKF